MKTPSKASQIGDSGIYLVPVVIGNLIPLVTLSVFTRVLTPADYGLWALATAYAVFTTGLANFGLTVSYERNFFEHQEGRQPAQLLYSVLLFVGAAYLLCAAVTWTFRRELSAWLTGTADAGDLVFWATCANGMSSLKWYYLTFFRNSAQARLYAWFTIDETLLTTMCSLVLVAYLRVGVIGLAWGQLAAATVVFVAVTVRFLRTLPPAFDGRVLLSALKLGYPLTPRIFVGVLANNLDKYLLAWLGSVSGVGVYTIGQKVSYLVFAYTNALENVFAPQVYQRMFGLGAAGGRSIGTYLTPFIYISVGMAVVVSLFSEEVLTVLTPVAYHGAIPVVNLFTIYYAVMFFGKQPQLVYAKKTYLLSVLTIVSLAINVTSNVVFITLFGAIGAAIGMLVAGILSVSLYNIVASRYYQIEWEYAKIALIFAALVAAAAATVVSREMGVAYPVRLAIKLALLGGFLGIGVKLRIVTRENLAVARDVVRRRFRILTGRVPDAVPPVEGTPP